MQRHLEPEHEAALIEKAKEDPKHFKQLYRAYIDRVYAYVAYRLKDKHEAEDLTATIFMQTLRQLFKYDSNQGSFSTWLFSITHNAVIDYWRRTSRANHVNYENETFDSKLNSPEQHMIQSEQSRRIRETIALLPERRQEVLVLKFFSGLRNMEIAAVLGLDERTVASHLSRALDDMRKLIVTQEEWHDRA